MSVSFYNTLRDFKRVDWSFSKHSSSGHITSLHPYPARFIPIIPRTIIEGFNFENRQLNIMDPFAGCGTTIVEGLNLNHNVVGVDVNGLASLLQRVYSYNYTQEELNSYRQIFEKTLNSSILESDDYISLSIPNVDHWFNKSAQKILYGITSKTKAEEIDEEIKDLIRFTLSRIIVKISNQQSDTQYRALNKNFSYKQMVDIVRQSSSTVYNNFSRQKRSWVGTAKIIQGDARKIETYKNIDKVDLVITSPPYPNAYEYWLYHKYRMFWLNMDPLWCRSNEIGARPFYSGTGKKNEFDFQNDIEEVLKQIYSVSHKNTLQFWVVGDSIIKGRLIDNVGLISNACKNTGWKVLDKIERKMTRSKSSFQGIGRQKKEELVIITRND